MSQSQQPVRQQQAASSENAGGGQSAALTAPVGQQYPTRSYLPESVRTTSVGLLNQALADLSAVTMQLKHAHWNVKGIEFYQLHELFEDLYERFEPHIDAVAERASALGDCRWVPRPPSLARRRFRSSHTRRSTVSRSSMSWPTGSRRSTVSSTSR